MYLSVNEGTSLQFSVAVSEPRATYSWYLDEINQTNIENNQTTRSFAGLESMFTIAGLLTAAYLDRIRNESLKYI